MQSNIFAKAALLLKEKKFNIDCNAVVNFLNRHYRSGQWIYPDALHRSFKISIVDAYEIMEVCVEAGIVEQNLEIYCPYCQRFTGNYYKTLFDIPDYIECVHCDNEIEKPAEHAIIIYKVL